MIALRRARAGRTAPADVAASSLSGRVILLGLACLAVAVTAGLLAGPVRLSAGSVLGEIGRHLGIPGLRRSLDARDAAIVWELRLPRVALGALVGAMLAASGAAYQGVFRNPLADPYLLGAASGAALGATLALRFLAPAGYPGVPLAAFGGALAGVALSYVLGRSAGGTRGATSLILAGVAVASFLTAVQTYLSIQDERTFREVSRWILGGLTTAGWREVLTVLPYAVVSTVALLLHRRLLDVLALGEDQSETLGVRSGRVRLWVVGAASLGTAAAVSAGGLIGFVGIIVPHSVRLVAGPSYRLVLPLSLLFGAAFLVAADALARTVLAPAELPIGVVTAFFGAPFFALLLRSRERSG